MIESGERQMIHSVFELGDTLVREVMVPRTDVVFVERGKTLRQAMVQIVLADLSMSLDNVLAVAGAAREHPLVLVLGLGISVVLMGAAASVIARLLERFRWIAWVGLLIVLYVALKLLWDGGHDIMRHMPAPA